MTDVLAKVVTAAEEAEAAARSKVTLWRTAERSRRQELTDLEAQVGDALLADPHRGEQLMEQVAGLRQKAEAAEKTAEAAMGKWQAARTAVPLAQADVVRAQAQALWAEAAERQTVTLRLLDELREHEGVAFGVTEMHPMNGGPAFSRTDQLVERARQLDAQAAALVTTVRGEGVQVSPGPIAAGGKQTVHVAAHAICEPGETRRFTVLIDGEPLRQADGRQEWLTVNRGTPTLSRTIEVPFGATVEVRGDVERATTVRQPVTAAA